VIVGPDQPEEDHQVPEPIDYEAAVRDLLRRRRQKRFLQFLTRVPDPRPTSPGQVVLVGFAILILGWLIPPLHVAIIASMAVLVLGFVSGLIQPRGRSVVWRNRNVEFPPEKRWTHRVYHVFYRQGKRR
jgi:hypothetical protein